MRVCTWKEAIKLIHQNKDSSHIIVLFDGVCNFCSGWVRFIIQRDTKKLFRFASLQSTIGDQLLQQHQLTTSLDSIVVIENGKAYTESTAILRILKNLPGLWRLLYVFVLLPKFIRDRFYKLFAKNRYRWFGKQESCMLPTPEIRERFLEMTS